MLGVQLNKDFYETHSDYGLALIHFAVQTGNLS